MNNRRRLTLVTFGFKYGPPNTNYYFDVSFLKNPARDPRWDLFATPDDGMREFVLSQPLCRSFLENVTPLIQLLLECDDDVRVGLGCSSGRHRSVILAEELKRRLESPVLAVRLIHREEVLS
jgi:RNase adaptor protein for sRNA GlmZ degradation